MYPLYWKIESFVFFLQLNFLLSSVMRTISCWTFGSSLQPFFNSIARSFHFSCSASSFTAHEACQPAGLVGVIGSSRQSFCSIQWRLLHGRFAFHVNVSPFTDHKALAMKKLP